MQAAGDRQVQHQPEVAIQAHGDVLSHSPQLAHSSSGGFREGRRGGSKKGRAYKPDAFGRQAHHARFQRRNVSGDVGQLRAYFPQVAWPRRASQGLWEGRTKGEGAGPAAAQSSRRGLLRYGRAEEDAEASVTSSVGVALAKRSGPANFPGRRIWTASRHKYGTTTARPCNRDALGQRRFARESDVW
jgi:hypothetical protein